MAIIPFSMTPEFLIPFLFIFAVVFGVLNLTNIFKNRAVDGVIGFALAAFAATNTDIVELISGFLPTAITFFIIVFFLAFIMKLFGLDPRNNRPDQKPQIEGVIVGGAVLFVLLGVGYYAFQQFPVQFPVIGGGENLIFFIGFLMIISIFWGAMKLGAGEIPGELRQRQGQ